MNIGDRVSWMTVKGERFGSVRGLAKEGIVIQLNNGKVIVADIRSLKKV